MTTSEGTGTAEQRLAFGRYVLNLRRSSLQLDGREIALKPKTFGVLCYLVQHPRRLISKEELLAAIWPDLVVSDDALMQPIDESRSALGEAGARMIVSVPGGYRFEDSEAPRDRRRNSRGHLLRWRWMYGILAPFALLLTFVVLWLSMRGCAAL
jgi:DNA-binding winged helix-turn-helix (wHTH) protein